MRRKGTFAGVGLLAVVAVMFLTVTPGYASTTQIAQKFSFPSSSSTVVASQGFIDGTQVGYFWSAARGDSVSQTLSGPSSAKRVILKVDVVSNVLSGGSEVDWDLVINGHVVGSFIVAEGVTGPITLKRHFHRIVGSSYDVAIRVTNEVPSGDGSISLAYAGSAPHAITLLKS